MARSGKPPSIGDGATCSGVGVSGDWAWHLRIEKGVETIGELACAMLTRW
jgi:hypothetical protein